MTLKANEYQCSKCHRVFEHGWSEEEAMEEARANGFIEPKEKLAIICDDCYQALKKMGWV